MGISLVKMDPSKPAEPQVDPSASIPRAREEPRVGEEPLVGEVIPKGMPLKRPAVYARPEGAPAGSAERRKRRPLRTVLIVVAAVASAVCLVGLIVGYVVYDKATTPERGTPRTTLTQYLEAKFTNRDESRVRLFECRSPKLEQMDALLDDLKDRERQFDVTIALRSYDMAVTATDDSARIDASLEMDATVDGVLQRQVQRWQFDLVWADGWRVCGARRTD